MNSRNGGFTLIEMVLAMTALALLAGICYGAFHLGIRAVQSGEVAVVTAQRLRVATDVLIRQVKSAIGGRVCARNEDEEEYPFFFGTPTSLAFLTAAGLQNGGSVAKVTYHLEADPPRLILDESSHFSPTSLGTDPIDRAGERASVLLEGFRGLAFQYLYNDGADAEWRSAWDAREEEIMPSAVRITVEGLPGLEVDTWTQEIPIMLTSYGDNAGECEEDSPGEGVGGDDSDDGEDTGLSEEEQERLREEGRQQQEADDADDEDADFVEDFMKGEEAAKKPNRRPQ